MKRAEEIRSRGQEVWLLLKDEHHVPIIYNTQAMIWNGHVEYILRGKIAYDVMQNESFINGQKDGVLGYSTTYAGASRMQERYVQDKLDEANTQLAAAQAEADKWAAESSTLNAVKS